MLTVGSLIKRKNQREVIAALPSIREELNPLYVIVGDGPNRDELESLVRELDLADDVILTGRVGAEDLLGIYDMADLFVLPSTSEGFSLVVLEALSHDLPVVAFDDIEGIPDIYDPGCFELAGERSTPSLVKALERALGRDWHRGAARDRAALFNWGTIGHEYLRVYCGLVGRPGSDQGSMEDNPK